MSLEEPLMRDVAIIGAGPSGLFSVFECGMLGLSCHVIDALPAIGGQCTALYPEKPIYDIPGFPKIEAGALIEALKAQAAPFKPQYHLGQSCVGLTPHTDGSFVLETSHGTKLAAKAVIIAGGPGAFGPNRPPLENLAAFENISLFYMVSRKEDFRGKRVVIAGGGDSAVDWALSLHDVAARVMVVHRRDQFRAAPQSVAQLKTLAQNGTLDLVIPYQLSGLSGTQGQITRVSVSDLDGQTKHLDADCVLAFFGLAATLGPIAQWGLTREGAHITIDPTTAATNIPGIFAVGDMAHYPHKLKLILTGFAEAAAAAHSAYRHIYPGKALHVEYSTTKGIPA